MTDSYSVLIVDDDAIVRESIGALLEEQDIQLFFAENGQEALRLSAEKHPDVILLDVMMPGMDGFDVCRHLRADPTLAEVPILLITALDDRNSRLAGFQAGADDFLTKPVDGLELYTRVQTILRLNRYRKLLQERANFEKTLEAKNRQLRELTQHLIEVQETERRFIATELHDDVGQMITGLKLMLEMASTQAHGELTGTLEQARSILSEISNQIRNLSLDLRPAMLDDFGLFAALEWLFNRFTSQTHIHIRHNFSFMDEHRFTKAIETAAFRIIQESLTNSAKYAEVSEVEVSIWVGEKLEIEIRDRGKGFNIASVEENAYQSGGISGMRERVSWLGGEFTIHSRPGAGTIVRANFRLGDNHAQAQ